MGEHSRMQGRTGREDSRLSTRTRLTLAFPPTSVWHLVSRRMCYLQLPLHFDKEEQIVYQINEGMPEIYRMTEYNFTYVLYVVEQTVSRRATKRAHY